MSSNEKLEGAPGVNLEKVRSDAIVDYGSNGSPVNTSDTTEPEDNEETENESEGKVNSEEAKGSAEKDGGMDDEVVLMPPPSTKTYMQMFAEYNKLRNLVSARKGELAEILKNTGVIQDENQLLTLELQDVQKRVNEESITLEGKVELQKKFKETLEGRMATMKNGIREMNNSLVGIISQLHANPVEGRLKEIKDSAKGTLAIEPPPRPTKKPPKPSRVPAKTPTKNVIQLALDRIANRPPPLPPQSLHSLPKSSEKRKLTKKHPKREHAVDTTKSHLGFYCVCGASVTSKHGLRTHILYHTSPPQFQCSVKECGKRYFTTSTLRVHMKAQHKLNYTGKEGCRRCGQTFASRMQLYVHCQNAHKCGPLVSHLKGQNEKGSPSTKQVAIYQPSSLPAKRERKTPAKYSGDVQLQKPSRLPSNLLSKKNSNFPVHKVDTSCTTRFQCTCGTPFTTKSAMDSHIKMRSKRGRFHCPFCPNVFPRRDYLRKHVEQTHRSLFEAEANSETPTQHGVACANNITKQFECLCGMTFIAREVLREHIRFKLGTRQYNCDLCKERFQRSDDLTLHMQRKHSLVRRGFACRICGMGGFRSTNEVKQHRQIYHNNGNVAGNQDKLMALPWYGD